MKVPLSWLGEYVAVALPVPQLVERLTLAGLEVCGVQLIGLPPPEGLRFAGSAAGPVWDRDKIFVAQVLEVRRHPDADRLTLVDLDYGAASPKTVVTGAPNLKVGDRGQKVILALSGSTLYDGHAQGKVLKTLKPTKIRGVPSDAMVCSAKELGIGDDHEGVIILEDDAPVGTPLVDFMGDVVLELDVLPNMARCLSLLGVARELAALTDQPLRYPSTAVAEEGGPAAAEVEVQIDDGRLCARYTAAVIHEVAVRPSPGWMQRRLSYAGMRPINNIVDITNYVMLEWGQPLHAFDYDALVGRGGGKPPRIVVRPARPGEMLTTLDGLRRELGPEYLLIADAAGPIALAGVMGGIDTEVTESTRNILLESASFDFITVRRTARSLNLPSEASHRFSRGVHPALAGPASRRAAEMMRRHGDGVVCSGLVEQYPSPPPPQQVVLSMAEVARLLGYKVPQSEAARILRALEFEVKEQGDELVVRTPSHRLDIQRGPADLIEEIARIIGYDRMPAAPLSGHLPRLRSNRPLELEERVRDLLVNAGLQEVMTYSLTAPEKEAALTEAGEYLRLANPISSERVVMRRSVLASVLEVAAQNLRHREGVRLFEIGRIYLVRPDRKLPDEPARLALAACGPRDAAFWADQAEPQLLDFFDLKGIIEYLLRELHVSGVEYRPARVKHLHPGQAAEVVVDRRPIGSFGRLHPELTEPLGLGRRTVFCGELDLDALLAAVPQRFSYAAIPEYPPVRQDLAIVVGEEVPAERITAEILAAGGELLRDVRLFDLYRGPNLPPGKKSLAYALTYQSAEKTLTDREVAKVHSRIVSRLEQTVGGRLRG